MWPSRQLPLRRHTFTIAAMIAVLMVMAAASALIWWRFHIDVEDARGRAARGSAVLQTRCGAIEYQEAGQGVPLLMVHGSGGGHVWVGHDEAVRAEILKWVMAHPGSVGPPGTFGILDTPGPPGQPAVNAPPAPESAYASSRHW